MSASDAAPGVSYVMPVLNEVAYLDAAVRSILAQRYDGPTEVILALGPSTDGTAQLVERLRAELPELRTVENPAVDIPAGLNRAIEAARYPVVIRVDAHTELDPDYTRTGVATLLETGAASVGGVMAATGRPGFQIAVARAYNSRFGLGGGAYHAEKARPGPAESAYMSVLRADVVRELGGFDESLNRGEDWEFHYRMRQAGHGVWLDPRLRVLYWPRDTWPKLTRQFFATGVWRGELVRRLGLRNPLRFFAPPALLLDTALTLVLAMIVAGLAIAGVGVPPALAVILGLGGLGLLMYLGLLVAAAVRSQGGLRDRVRFMLVVATMHLSWGAGFLSGWVVGARGRADTSRTES